MDTPVAFHDLPADAFPFTVKFFDIDTKIVYHEETVNGPGAMKINRKPDHVRRAGVTMRLANGEEHTFEG